MDFGNRLLAVLTCSITKNRSVWNKVIENKGKKKEHIKGIGTQ